MNLIGKREKIENELGKTAKIFGEIYTIHVVYKKINNPELDLLNKKIIVNLPNKYKRNGNIQIIKLAIEKMYDEIARIEIESIMEETRIKLKGLAPDNFKIKRIENKLSQMTADKTIIINPEVIKYNKQILRYIVLYEFCKLKYRTNSKKFKDMLEKNMPCYEEYEYIKNVA